MKREEIVRKYSKILKGRKTKGRAQVGLARSRTSSLQIGWISSRADEGPNMILTKVHGE
jgi:hypothetical protein